MKIKQTAASDELLRGDAPIVEVFPVDHITYSRHEKVGRPPMLKVTYYCGLRSFSEYVCIEHEGFAGRKARQWWRERTSQAFPESTDDALNVASNVSAATHLRVWVNKQYPEILAHCFDGTAFGQQEAGAPPTTDTAAPRVPTPVASDLDDDIPF